MADISNHRSLCCNIFLLSSLSIIHTDTYWAPVNNFQLFLHLLTQTLAIQFHVLSFCRRNHYIPNEFAAWSKEEGLSCPNLALLTNIPSQLPFCFCKISFRRIREEFLCMCFRTLLTVEYGSTVAIHACNCVFQTVNSSTATLFSTAHSSASMPNIRAG